MRPILGTAVGRRNPLFHRDCLVILGGCARPSLWRLLSVRRQLANTLDMLVLAITLDELLQRIVVESDRAHAPLIAALRSADGPPVSGLARL